MVWCRDGKWYDFCYCCCSLVICFIDLGCVDFEGGDVIVVVVKLVSNSLYVDVCCDEFGGGIVVKCV